MGWDEKPPYKLANGKVEVVEQDTIWRGFVRLLRLKVRIPSFSGGVMEQVREIHHHGSAATLLPYDPQRRKLLLVRQWRIPPLMMGDAEPLLEIVAGIIDEGETPEQAARREAVEETGHEVEDLQLVMQGYSSPGTVTEYFYLFAGTYHGGSKRHDGGGLAHEEEDIEVVELDFDEAFRMLRAGEIRDAKTFIALTWLVGAYGNG